MAGHRQLRLNVADRREIDLRAVDPGPDIEVLGDEVVSPLSTPPVPRRNAPEAPYLGRHTDPASLAGLWEAAANL